MLFKRLVHNISEILDMKCFTFHLCNNMVTYNRIFFLNI